MANAFITGSKVYGGEGYGGSGEDVDLVILVDEVTKQLLLDHSDLGKYPVRFGKLNLIITSDEKEYAAWLLATHTCLRTPRLTKEKAIHIHEEIRKSCGIEEHTTASTLSREDRQEIRDYRRQKADYRG